MKKIPFCILLIALLFSACDKEVLKEEEPDKKDSTEINHPQKQDTSFVTVAGAQTIYKEEGEVEVFVSGYIVGCISGTSLSGAHFVPPFYSESNLLIADDSAEVDAAKCLPVSLTAGSNVRESLNLKTHENLWHCKVAFQGYLQKYFRVVGIKKVLAYAVLDSCKTVK